eukprot:scaffold175554_cov13-Tisochrysis_lutea.AAC.1
MQDRQHQQQHADLCKHLHEKSEKKGSSTWAEETFPTAIKEKETHWLTRAATLLLHKALEQKGLVGIWTVTGSTRLQNLAVD